MTSKMTGKQAVAGAFDLNKFAAGADEPRATEKVEAKSAPKPKATPTEKTLVPKPQSKKGKGGRPPKEAAEALTERVQILLSPSEMAKIKEKAGLAAVSVVVRKHLKDTGLI